MTAPWTARWIVSGPGNAGESSPKSNEQVTPKDSQCGVSISLLIATLIFVGKQRFSSLFGNDVGWKQPPLRFELLSARLGLFLRWLLFLLPLVTQPAFGQQVGNAVQKRLNSFLDAAQGFFVGMFCHGQGLQGLRLSPATPPARHESTAKRAGNRVEKQRFPPHKRKE
jgi:hypothetical protein